MDNFLVDYIKSGNAWLLIGSGPSVAMGYPSWKALANHAVELVNFEAPKSSSDKMQKAYQSSDYPGVFEEAFQILGPERVLLHLHEKLIPTSRSVKIYDLLARWPIPVYLTTNYDDAIQTHLTQLRETYLPYTNGRDHMAYLNPSLKNAIFKIHGDLRSTQGLILTRSQYQSIQNDPQWNFWRETMAAIFRMQPIIMVGVSLSDPHIKYILQVAKESSGVHQPVCWIAPDINFSTAQDLLYNYRIRVIPYDNRDGTHGNLVTLIEHISKFVFPRTSVKIQKEIEDVTRPRLGQSASAPGFFVFNKIALHSNFEQYRINIVVAAIRAIVPTLLQVGTFSLHEALTLAGWPKDFSLANEFSQKIMTEAVNQRLLSPKSENFTVGPEAEHLSSKELRQYEHVRNLFLESLKNRIRRTYTELPLKKAEEIANDIEKSLVGFFRECGLALSTTLLDRTSRTAQTPMPSSVIKFINQATTKYDDILSRQVFSTTAVDIFMQSEVAEREYLGRISQGFFAFHALGLFGEAAQERLEQARQTIWLVDSNLQIPALALAAPTNAIYRDCFARLRELGVRLFTTEKLFQETTNHFLFAENIIQHEGALSDHVLAAATGQAPYRKANQFLEGFVRWRAAGNPNDWEAYMLDVFREKKPKDSHIKEALLQLGIDTINLATWPGYKENDEALSNSFESKIVGAWQRRIPSINDADYDPDLLADFHKKAQPEADALVIITKERDGDYYMLSDRGQHSPAWFISQTSMLNVVNNDPARITWQPEAFLRFTSTLAPSSNSQDANRAFDMLLLSFTQLGVSLLDEKTLNTTFGGIIDDAQLRAQELDRDYENLLSEKYAESPAEIIRRLKPSNRPIAIQQFENELMEQQSKKLQQYQKVVEQTASRAVRAEQELQKLTKIKQKFDEKRRERKRKSRKKKGSKK